MLQWPYLRHLLAHLTIFFKAASYIGGDDPEAALPPPPETPVLASTIVEMVIERAVSIDTIVIPCS